MGFITTALGVVATWPKGLWESLIKVFYDGITNYAWAIIVLTIVLKLLMTPFDFLQRRTTAKNTKMQTLIAPEMAKLQKQYGNNKQILNQKQMELYKKYNYNITGSCVVMLVNLVLTLVIFITFFNGLRNIASFKAADQYQQLRQTYVESIYDETTLETYKDENGNYIYETIFADIKTNYIDVESEENTALINIANKAVQNKYGKIKDSWLWIKNVWQADTQTSVIATFDQYTTSAKLKFETDAEKASAKEEYNLVMQPLKDSFKGGNGYYIMTILVIGVTFLSQWLMKLSTSPKKKKGQPAENTPPTPGTGKIMMFLLPAFMAIFTLTSNAAFALYLFASSLVSTAITPLMSLIMKTIDKKQEKKRQEEIKVSYKR